jgi:glycosyltransferase involved in cell wall biosynthesis
MKRLSEVLVSIYFQFAPRLIRWRLVTGFLNHPSWALLRRWIPIALRQRIRAMCTTSVGRDLRFVRTPAWYGSALRASGKENARASFGVSSRTQGLNLYGLFSRWLGLGECARLHARALLDAGFPVSLHDVDIDIPHARNDQTFTEHFREHPSYARDLIFVNPDHWSDTLQSIYGPAGKRDRYVIGYWFWELEEFPNAWLPALEQVDEIMVSSRFVERCLRNVTKKPITRVPLPVLLGHDSGLQRHHFGLNEHDYVFYCSFDFNSMVARKNPLAVIDAFCKAFPRGDEKVSLLIKSFNGHRDVVLLMKLAAIAARDRRIILRDDLLERADLQALHRCVDVHVSLHRSEGFGLGMAEAMCMGKPVIATAYSGNMEYMTNNNSCLVNYSLIPVGEGEYYHGQGQRWADPETEHAAHYMRALYQDRELGARLGKRAAQDMARDFSVDAFIGALQNRLLQIDDARCSVAVN